MAKVNMTKAILTDPQFWVPVVALVFGIVLLALLH
jgi:hypothetical protein